MRAEFSTVTAANHACLAPITNCKQQGDDILTSFIHKWRELLQSCGISAEQYSDKLNLYLCLSQLLHEKIARGVIHKHQKTMLHAFHIAK